MANVKQDPSTGNAVTDILLQTGSKCDLFILLLFAHQVYL
jgi:hypothetical protein